MPKTSKPTGRAALKAAMAEMKADLPKKGNKYRARKIEAEGYKFDSLREFARFKQLRLLEQAGKISGLIVHPAYRLVVEGVDVGGFKPDFSYVVFEHGVGPVVVEDVKSKPTRTEAYMLRMKVFKATHPHIEFREVF